MVEFQALASGRSIFALGDKGLLCERRGVCCPCICVCVFGELPEHRCYGEWVSGFPGGADGLSFLMCWDRLLCVSWLKNLGNVSPEAWWERNN
jgi:hypothetical protein